MVGSRLANEPRSDGVECYGSIFPIFPPINHLSQVTFKRCYPPRTQIVSRTVRAGVVFNMAKSEKLDPVWDDLDR